MDNNEIILDLGTTVNFRVSNVITAQARQKISTAYSITSMNTTTDNLNILLDESSSNRENRIEVFKDIVKTNYLSANDIVVWVTSTVNVLDTVTTLTIKLEPILVVNNTPYPIETNTTLYTTTKETTTLSDVKKFLSSTLAGPVNETFSDILTKSNAKLKEMSKLPLETMVIGAIDEITIDRKSDNITTNTSTTVIVPNTTNTSTEQSNTTDNTKTNQDTQNTDVQNKEPKKSNKFLEIESVSEKYDQLLLHKETTGFISVKLSGEDTSSLLTRDNQTSSATQSKSTQSTNNIDSQNVAQTTPTPEQYTKIVNSSNQQATINRETEAQRQAEFNDTLLKEKVKKKSLIAAQGVAAVVNKVGGKNRAIDKLKDSKLPPKATPKKPISPIFFEWMRSDEGKDPKGIIYRGNGERAYLASEINSPSLKTRDMVESRYKSLFNYGKDLSKIFGGLNITSPIDVAIAINSVGVGRFNKNIPYIFSEGSETHLAILRATSDAYTIVNDGGLGKAHATENTAKLDANWSEHPYWCGISVNFMLWSNGQYVSDENKIDITGTGTIDKLYGTSPYNKIKKPLSKQERIKLEKQLDELQADTTGASQTKINEIKEKLDTNLTLDSNGQCVLLQLGYHWNRSGDVTSEGRKILSSISNWPGGFLVRRLKGHTEVLLHINSDGVIYTIGGNTTISSNERNGTVVGFKKYTSISDFCGKDSDKLYIYKRGTSNPYTLGIGNKVKKTDVYSSYVTNLSTDKELDTAAYNILREIMET